MHGYNIANIIINSQTVSPEGLLVSSTSDHSYLIVYLHSGIVYVSVSVSGSTHYSVSYIQLGRHLHDNRYACSYNYRRNCFTTIDCMVYVVVPRNVIRSRSNLKN